MIKHLKITLLSNNIVYGTNLLAEHGLSYHIKYDGKQLLFDTGQGLVLKHNAEELGIDLGCIDKIALSHGHYDHTGGLKQIADLGNSASVFGHTDLFMQRFGKAKTGVKEIGIPFSRDDLEKSGMRFHLSDKSGEIDADIFISGQISRDNPDKKVGFLRDADDNETPDPVIDDLFLLISTVWGDIAVLGCTHSGIRNSMQHAASLKSQGPIKMVMGGMHLIASEPDDIDDQFQYLRDSGVRYVMPIHCSGRNAICAGARIFKDGFIEGVVGTRIVINETGVSWQ